MKHWFLLSAFLLSLPLQAQDKINVAGIVSDETGDPIPGVNVLIQGTMIGTVTDIDGAFHLTEVPVNAYLTFSFIGYSQLRIQVTDQTELNITLQPEESVLNEVVVVGYGTQKRRELTGAVTSVKSEDLQKVNTGTFTTALQGKTPGVFISQTSGAPGSAASVRIRGVGTTGGNQPLYVIDGFPIVGGSMGVPGSSDNIDLMSIVNPNDIESIEILKDAAASSIYGARAANGVILITTKRGKEGMASVNLDVYGGVQQLWRQPEFLNAEEFTTLANELYTNSGMTQNPEWANPSSFGEGTNWIDQVFRTAPVQNYDLRITGGNQKINSSISLGYRDEQGTLIESWHKRFTGRATADMTVSDKIKIGGSLAFTYTRAQGQQNQNMRLGIFNLAQQFYPTLGPDDVVDGSSAYYTTQGDNPVLRAKSIDNQLYNLRLLGNAFLEYEVLPGLKWKTNLGGDASSNRTSTWEPAVERGHYRNLQARLDENISQGYGWLIENTLSYNKTFNKHSISGVVGQTAQKNLNNSIAVNARDLQNEQLRIINGSNESERRGFGSGGIYTLASYLGRVNYSYNEKYLFSASIRRDGSSNFGPNHKWGNFPSVSAGWNLGDEDFLKDYGWLDSFKLRASWGQLGNDAIGAFGYLNTIRIGTVNDNYVLGTGQQLAIGASIARPGNPDLRWETNEQTDIGVDATFFDGKVYLTADYFIKTTKDMLVSLPVSYEAGFQSATSVNGGKVLNRGLELLLGYQGNINAVEFNVSGNITTLKNEVLSLGVGQPINGPTLGFTSISSSYTEVGQPIGYFRGYIVDGIYQSEEEINSALQPNARPGDFIFRDLNGDNQLTDADRTKIGSPWPTLMYGMNMDFNYKGFDLNILIQGVSGNQIFHSNKFSIYPLKYFGGSGVVNASREMLNRWTPETGGNEIPRLAYTDSNGNYGNSSSFYVEDGSFMRVRNVTLGYRLNPQLMAATKLFRSARIYLSAMNLFTFTKYSGFDPEIASFNPLQSGIDDGVYPQPRTILAGLNLSF
jgi:TonB-linked SusC/RagA family outer membrane protein